MAYIRPCDRTPPFDHRAKPKPRRPPQFDASYDPVAHILVFDPSGRMVGYKPRAAVPEALKPELEGTSND